MKKLTLLLSLFILVSCVKDTNKELTIFTSRQPQLLEPIIEKYFQETGVKVNLLSGNAQELMERIDIEGEQSKADIFMTVDAGVLWQAAERNIFSETKSKILEENVPKKKKKTKKLKPDVNELLKNVSIPKGLELENIDLEKAQF
jgi:iron(III) transport system substrate-binding protein